MNAEMDMDLRVEKDSREYIRATQAPDRDYQSAGVDQNRQASA